MSVEEHQKAASDDPRNTSLAVGVITVSDTRTRETDRGGDRLAALLTDAGHVVSTRFLVSDDPEAIETAIQACLAAPGLRAILLTGGTGLAPRDGTVEVVRRHLKVEIPGYGELVRRLGVDEIGPAAILGRAIAGVAARPSAPDSPAADVLIFTMPGSVQAVASATSGVILPILPHAAWQVAGGHSSPRPRDR